MELADFQIPYDPESYHQLHWQPGTHGKGVLTNEGQLHTWSTRTQDGYPIHSQYMKERGIPLFKGETRFWVKPDGDVRPVNHDGNQQLELIPQIDPRLYVSANSDQWNFARVAVEIKRPVDLPFNLIDDAPEVTHTPQEIADDEWLARRPFLYQPDTNTVFVGKPGDHHQHIIDRHERLRGDLPYNEGFIMKGYPDRQYPHPDEASFYYDENNRAHLDVLEALAHHYGVGLPNMQGDWDFASSYGDAERDPFIDGL